MIKVKNLNGTSDRVPNGYSSWLAFWEAKAGRRATQCNRFLCSATSNLVGAHVKKVDGNDNSWYIVPLCHADNMSTEEFYVNGPLISVNA